MNMADGASSSIPPKNYDVFISFRGEDTRNNFTGHLYAALCRKQIKAYIDENDLKRGDEISPALLKAIRGSKFCLIVLSKQYASSTWCLDELQHILQCKGKDRQEILPIFYNVDPSHVRKQKESYATAFIELEKRFEDRMNKVKAWRDALTEVGGLSGWAYSSQDGSESKLVEAVVEEIIKKLNHTSSSNNLKGLVGVDERINQIGSLLCIGSLDVRIIGIWGMGGIGKTTLARAVFNRFSSQFEACSFLANVREESEKHLEKKLFSELLEEENVNPVKWPFLKDRLHRKKGIEAMEGISLDTTNVNEEVHLSPMTFSKMRRLRLLIIRNGRKVFLSQGPLPFPDTLSYLSWPAYPLKSLSTCFTAKKLVQLNLRCSKLERLWDGVVHLENLKGINLAGSRHLTQLPDLSLASNIESINLKFCDRLIEVPSSFQQLDKLEDLNFIGCSSLSNISRLPNNLRRLNVSTSTFCETTECHHCLCHPVIKNVKCLVYPNHDRKFKICSKLEKFPEILEPLRSLEDIKLDYTAIKELPLSIEHLIGLKRLSVRYCENLAFLPNTIHKLESLGELRLGHCRNLKSLPELPLYLSILEADGCTSLETVSSTSTTLLTQNWDHSWIIDRKNQFLFLDCRKLNENARKNLMDEAQSRIFHFATMYSKYRNMYFSSDYFHDVLQKVDFQFRCPGSEIPRWINHQSEGSSISINFPPHVDQWFNKTYLGLAICLVLEKVDYSTDLDDSSWTSFSYECLYTYPNGNSLTFKGYALPNWYYENLYSLCPHCNHTEDYAAMCKEDAIDMNCEHVLLYFDGCFGEYLYMRKEKYESNENGFTSTTTATTATASFSFKPKTNEVKVKKCGVHLLYVQEADNFGFVQPYDWEGRLRTIRWLYKKKRGAK